MTSPLRREFELVVVFGRGLTTGIVLLSVLLAALGLFVAALTG